ncbi:prolyl oligopeptidase family serine peptidase [Actinotalea sp. M2MS4P-6]|uniref:alpha/beta hydrolase family protein n=1 Tax=Actinotalea sp. M2MS4P-6 TaxID=2983762 RepID=UPI0021E4AA47|nr:acyl-CoA thioester hydrolase/BAAT C-terminal domain-containing protein [Actinotalea sp. M2MS4P-6]MCV2393925.1 prolyl oligopeptidase family serine peptidase [Actinotalea sp. M2MS4P-6]
MRYRIALTSALVVVGLGVLGAVSGPGWDPVPMTATIDVASPDTAIDGADDMDPIGTYEVESTVITVELAGTSVEAQITQPIGAPGDRPGVVFVHGAGTGKFTDAFVDQARALASAGIVTLVPNKRLDTYSTRSRDYVAMANDYLRSVDALRAWPGVDPSRVGVYGESEGCWIVPVMAADNPSVAFTALVAAPVVPPREQAAFAVDSYLRNTGVPEDVLRAIPRFVGMEFPGGGFSYADFDVEAFQQRMRQPVMIVYGTGDSAMPTVQGALQVIDDVTTAGNPDWTVRYYEGADHGIRVDDVVVHDFLRDLAVWVSGLPETGDVAPRIAGAEPYQRFLAAPVERPRWYAEGDLLVAYLVLVVVALVTGPVVWVARRLRGRRTKALADGVVLPLVVMAVSAVLSFLGFVVYLLVVANLAQNYRTSTIVVQGGWLAVRLLALASVIAGVVLAYRIKDGRRRSGKPAARTAGGYWCLSGSLVGSGILLVLLAYWNVFPALL